MALSKDDILKCEINKVSVITSPNCLIGTFKGIVEKEESKSNSVLMSKVDSLFAVKEVKKPEIVEVTFGLNETAAQTFQRTNDQNEGETEASKTIRELPQLTKNITPDTSPAIEEQRPNLNNPNTLTFKEHEKNAKKYQKAFVDKFILHKTDSTKLLDSIKKVTNF